MNKDNERVHTSVYIDRDLYAKLRHALIRENMTFADWIENQAQRYVYVTLQNVTIDGPAVSGRTSTP
jgi:hypothetical protein